MRIFFLALFVSLALVGCRNTEPPADANRVTLSITEGHQEYARLLAYQDGDGAWRELDANDGEYSFEVTDKAGRYGVAIVCHYADWGYLAPHVLHATTDELKDLVLPCALADEELPESDTFLTVTIENPEPGVNHAIFTRGWREYDVDAEPYTRTLGPLEEGLRDVVVYTESLDNSVGPIIIHHDIDTSTTVDLTVDYSRSLPLETYNVTIEGIAAGESISTYSILMTKNGTSAPLGGYGDTATSSAAYSGVFQAAPPAVLAAGDSLGFSAEAEDESGVKRGVQLRTTAASDLEISLPEGDLDLTVTPSTPGAYPRLGAAWDAVGGAFTNAYFSLESDDLLTGWDVLMSHGWLTETAYTIPDFSSLGGWDSAWNVDEADITDTSVSLTAFWTPRDPLSGSHPLWEAPLDGEFSYISAEVQSGDLQ